MVSYSNFHDEPSLPPVDFGSRLDSFFNGEPMPPKQAADLDVGGTAEQVEQRKVEEFENAMSALDDLDDDTIPDAILARFYVGDPGDIEPIEKTYDPINPACRYGKAFARVRALEARLDGVDPDNAHNVTADLEAAYRAWNVEKERALDDRFRKFHLVNNWRANEGRNKYNASRRKVRDKPNAKVSDMTPEERARHKLDKNAERQWRLTRRKTGWTDDRIEAELPGWWARRLAKRAGA